MSHFDSNSCLQDRPRVVITGLGIVSPLGRTVDDYWRGLSEPFGTCHAQGDESVAGHSGVADFSGQVDDFGDLPAGLRKRIRKSLKLMDRQTQLGVLAGQQALKSSGILTTYDPERMGVCFGADNAPLMPQEFFRAVAACSGEDGELEMDRWGDQGIPEMAPLWLLKCLPNMPACHLAILNDLRGPNNTVTTREVAFGMALAEACRNIRSGDADAMLVGATGSTLTPLRRLHSQLESEMTHDCATTERSRECENPSFTAAEGAGAFVLEELQSALGRRARIWGEILSSASASCVGHDGAAACGTALSNAMRECLRRAHLSPTSVGHIHAAGVQSPTMRTAQSQAIAEVFSTSASQVPVIATMHRIGNAGAGTGAMEVAASLLAINRGHQLGADSDCDANSLPAPDLAYGHPEQPGECFLSLSLLPRGLSHCVAVGVFHE